MNKLIDRIFTAKPVNLGLFLILMPFLAMIAHGLVSLILLLAKYELIFPIIGVALTLVVSVYFLWIWAICAQNRLKVPFDTNTVWFKVAFWLYFSYCAFAFIGAINIDSVQRGLYLDNNIVATLEIIASFYGLAVFVSYGYLALFAGKIVASSIAGHEVSMGDAFLYGIKVWAFPIGIPLIQAKLQGKADLFDIMRRNSPFR